MLQKYFKDWLKVIDNQELHHVLNILEPLYKARLICPEQKDVFKAFKFCSYTNLKIVMIGKEPYCQEGVSTGLFLGNDLNDNKKEISLSLDLLKESVINFELPHNNIIFDHSLIKWAEQGVLMLHTALTVECENPGSHLEIWRSFTSNLLKNLSETNTGIIYILFGKEAQQFKPYINKQFNYIYELEDLDINFNCQRTSTIFKTINKTILKTYGEPIEWFSEK